ncbi:SusC/RagA family TonB-linked outer membrane protein [Rufibacter immobilis]|uniref:SusC/RagA family TonB-linked outer membrane protein n=1 Tax=Rufibacter immobilis TaxID=1348778 RepID=A0A3M9N4U0_9BACT|nr:SusC/RagA family TonB-linked outer membrane protein [Rufibacter immobilis]RNI32337.1 SusC/RagA family TonB-linked outer membrane protein [Rufibacter immobilis]
MKILLRLMLFTLSLCIAQAGFAQSKTITGRVTSSEDGSAMPGVSVVLKGTTVGASTDGNGRYSIQAPVGGVLVYSFIGTIAQEKVVGASNSIDVILRADSKAIDEVVVTALGIQEEKKSLGYAITEIKGADVAQTQRENFVNGLAGRVAGVEVTSTSGLPGASSSIVIRGISSLSGNNQPLFVVDGLPISNNTTSTSVLASAGVTGKSFENRGVDFTNRGADINPEDIESITVLKGPEASALYGIEAASGAIVITTKRGKAGQGRINYSYNTRVSKITRLPERQLVYDRGVNGYTAEGNEEVRYFGSKFPEGTQFYDNIESFFETAIQQKHNVSFTGGSDKTQYRISGAYTDSKGYVPNTGLDQINLSSSISSTLNRFINTDVTFDYTRSDNNKSFTGANGAFLHLMLWPVTDDASNYLTPTGGRRDYAGAFSNDVENPFFNVNKNKFNTLTDRYRTNVSLTIDPTNWFKFVVQGGVDYYTEKTTIVRHPESNTGKSYGGLFDQSVGTTRNLTLQYYGAFNKAFFNDRFRVNFRLGSMVRDYNTFTASASGERFQAPNLYSINNTLLTSQRAFNNLWQYRNIGAFSQLTLSYSDMLYLTVTGRNDWTSTLPVENNSFFYPSAAVSFVFTELAPFAGIKDILSYGKLRGSIAQVGKDARPYSIRPFYETATTTGGGYRYGFTGPSFGLEPEMTTSYEFGTELKFFNDRFGIDATYFSKTSEKQIVKDLRLSYGTGFVLSTFNAGEIKNEGIELQMNASPVVRPNFTWDVAANFTKFWSELVSLPEGVTEFYNSDTFLYGNVRAGARPGGPLTTFTGYDYLRNNRGQLIINPTTGLPSIKEEWIVVGDKNPDFTVGVQNTFTYKNVSLNFNVDFRVGGDIYNATEHYMVTRGISPRTLSRETPRIVDGVLQDGLENTDNPTKNNIPIDVSRNSSYWSSIYYNNTFIEKDINWVRLRDITLNYRLPSALLQRIKFIKEFNIYVTGTDLFILTNYSGLDPIGAGTSAATGGAGGVGMDYGNFPTPRGLNFGIRAGF